MSDLLLLVHAASTWFMVGLIWFVQIVHYPLFGAVGDGDWVAYETRHQARTTWVVLPVMLVELVATVAIVMGMGDGDLATVSPPLAWLGAGLLVVVWGSTFLVQVPLHARLTRRHDPADIRRLIRSNWVRTVAWTVRGVLALLMLR